MCRNIKYLPFWALAVLWLLSHCKPKDTPSLKVKKYYASQTDVFVQRVHQFAHLAEQGFPKDSLQKAFLGTRMAYKRIEFLLAYYNEYTASRVNGAPIDEIEIEDDKVITPAGLQVIEAIVYADTLDRRALDRELKGLQSVTNRVSAVARNTTFTDVHVFDALRLSLFRMITLGITGYDAPAAKSGIAESAEVLHTLKQVISYYGHNNEDEIVSYIKNIDLARAYLNQHSDFDRFDRLAFISSYANNLCSQLLDVQKQLQISLFDEHRALKATAKTLFDTTAFDTEYFTFSDKERSTPAKVKFGEKLFYEPLLSGVGNVSCATCHQPDKAFTDGRRYPQVLSASKAPLRNTPTLLNAALQSAYFYDAKTPYLEEQADMVVRNPIEMHGDFKTFIAKIKDIYEYQRLFREAFPEKSVMEQYDIKNALACYIRTLSTMNSRFDEYMRGDTSQLNSAEKRGFNLFAGKAQCATCHFIPLFNGMVPPYFTKMEMEVLGVPAQNKAQNAVLGEDMGKYLLFPNFEQFKYAFKTTTVRNVGLTAPYMHNGVFETLEDVVEFYNRGGGAGIGIDLPYQTLSSDGLELSSQEKADIVKFMQSLTDKR